MTILNSIFESNMTVDLVNGLVGFIAGTFGGMANVIVGQPLDTVKVKMQAFPEVYKNSVQCMVDTFKKDGLFRGLYAGTMPALVSNVSENAVLFCALPINQKAVAYLRSKPVDQLSSLDHAVAGSGAAIWSTLVLCPTELVKCRLQSLREMADVQHAKQTQIGALQVARDIYRSEGVQGFTRGMSATFMREVPGYFFFFGGYEVTRSLLCAEGQDKSQIGPMKTAFAGGVGGIALWSIIFPFDVAKSRIQIGHIHSSAHTVENSPGLLKTMTDIIKNEGAGALYRGIWPTLIRTFPSTGALFVVVEYIKTTFSNMT
ncbi:hypothetical protein Ciccas_004514 [Cichlidogyrus casuarinus]|uniref:Mitochondrial ornithine transporter 1 n=1 Tax=Cichlidogyrus casuarinus TaxID=1844966 RepID=A0ABD2QBE7_9PLAT